jgi:hypothetical protein
MTTAILIEPDQLAQTVADAVADAFSKQPVHEPSEVLSVKQFTKKYNISPVTQWKLRKSGKLPFFTIGKMVFYKKNEVEQIAKG